MVRLVDHRVLAATLGHGRWYLRDRFCDLELSMHVIYAGSMLHFSDVPSAPDALVTAQHAPFAILLPLFLLARWLQLSQ